jgi:solute carrier family 25 folate transporter 32
MIGTPSSTGVNISAAFVAGLATLSMTNPLYVVKTRLSLRLLRRDASNPAPLPSAPSMLRQILRDEGVAGLYRGVVPSIFAIPQGTIQFAAYEWLKENIPRAPFHPAGQPLSGTEFFVAGAVSKVFASGFLYPYQVVRSRIVDELAPTRSSFEALRLLIKHDGPRALYRGLGTQLLRVTPHSAIALLVYEMTMKQARRMFPLA